MGGENLGYEATMVADLDASVGAVLFVNRFAVPEAEADFTLRILQALAEGGEFPSPPTPETPAVDLDGYAGTYASESGTLKCRVEDGSLVLVYDGEQIRPIHLEGDTFQVPHPRFARFLLRFRRQGSKVAEALHGGSWFRGNRYAGPASFDVSRDWQRYAGHYRSFAPLMRTFRVIEQEGQLVLMWVSGYAETPLIEDGDGRSRSDPPSFAFEILTFDCIADGKA